MISARAEILIEKYYPLQNIYRHYKNIITIFVSSIFILQLLLKVFFYFYHSVDSNSFTLLLHDIDIDIVNFLYNLV